MEVDPYRPPDSRVEDPASQARNENLRRLVISYRRLILWFGVQLLIGMGGAFAIVLAGPALGPAVGWVRIAAVLVTAVALILYSYRTASALGSTVPVVWAIAMLFPLVNLFTLLVLSSKATRACRAAGIPVGFLGPKRLPGSSS